MRAFLPGMTGKLIEIATETISGAAKFGFLEGTDDPDAAAMWREAGAASALLKVEIVRDDVRTPEQIENALQSKTRSGAAAVIVPGEGFFPLRQRIASLAAAARLPAICTEREFVVAGALISDGVSNRDIGPRRAAYVDKILRGTPPADLPVEFPTTLTPAVNPKTAKALGITVSPALLVRADEVIK
jgi:putative ABC transport system substrate-binding protein